MQTSEIAKRFDAESIGTDKYVAKCPSPAHADKGKALYIKKGRDERTLIKCAAACNVEQILAAVNLNLADLFVTPPAPGYIAILRAKLVATDARRLRQIAQCERATLAMKQAESAMGKLKARLKDESLTALLTEATHQLSIAHHVVSVIFEHV
jgi:hypothetical protein